MKLIAPGAAAVAVRPLWRPLEAALRLGPRAAAPLYDSRVTAYRFGQCLLDVDRRELRIANDVVHLQPRVFDVLAHLVAASGRAVPREELLNAVWRDVQVGDGSLSRAVRALRVALAADPETAAAVETVRGFGYRYSGPVESERNADRVPADPAPRDRTVVARERELAQLARAVETGREGRRRIVLIEGAAGLGKTTLVRQAVDAIGDDTIVAFGHAVDGHGTTSPYLPILEALATVGRGPWGPQLRAIVERAAPDWTAKLPALFPEARPSPAPFDTHPGELARQLVEVVELVAADVALILVVEDLQWADPATLALLRLLVNRTTPARLSLVATTRPTQAESGAPLVDFAADVARTEQGALVSLSALPRAAVHDYAVERCPSAITGESTNLDTLVDWLWERTHGHPLFLARLVDDVLARVDHAEVRDAALTWETLEAAQLPRDLDQLLAQWRERLAPAELSLVESASAIGDPFDVAVAAEVSGLDVDAAAASAERLRADGWLAFHGRGADSGARRPDRLRFDHALLRDACYAAISPPRRARLHAQIASALSRRHAGDPAIASELAVHYEAAGALENAARERVRAAGFATASQGVNEAIHHAEAGLAGLAQLPPHERSGAEVDLLLSLGIARATRYGYGDAEASDRFEQAGRLAESLGDPHREAAAAWGLSSSRQMRGEIEAARSAGERLLDLARRTGQATYLFYAFDLLCNIAYFQGRFRDCVELADASEKASRSAPDPDALPQRSAEDVRITAHLYASLARWHLDDERGAIAGMTRACEQAKQLGRPYTESVAECFAAILHRLVGDDARQLAHARRARRVSEAADIGLWREIARFMELCAESDRADPRDELRALLTSMAGYGGLGGTYFVGLLAEQEIRADRPAEARALCSLGIGLAEQTTEHSNLPVLLALHAGLEDDPDASQAGFERAHASAIEIGSIALQRYTLELRRQSLVGVSSAS